MLRFSTKTMAPVITPLAANTRVSLLSIMRSAKKPENVWFHIYYTAASFVVWPALQLGWTPNQVTIAAALLNSVGLVYFLSARTDPQSIVTTYIILSFAHVLDCADGLLASVGAMRSERGYWLDSSFDLFKSAYVALLMTKDIYSSGNIGSGQTWIDQVALCAAMGQFVNYATSLHALRYKQVHDGYKSASSVASGGRYVSAIVRNVREYGNWLSSFAVFAFDRRVALWCVIGLGSAHWMFALRRITTTSRALRSPG